MKQFKIKREKKTEHKHKLAILVSSVSVEYSHCLLFHQMFFFFFYYASQSQGKKTFNSFLIDSMLIHTFLYLTKQLNNNRMEIKTLSHSMQSGCVRSANQKNSFHRCHLNWITNELSKVKLKRIEIIMMVQIKMAYLCVFGAIMRKTFCTKYKPICLVAQIGRMQFCWNALN